MTAPSPGASAPTGVRIGPGLALVKGDVLVLLDRSEATVASLLWAQLDDGASLDAILTTLAERGVSQLGAFVMAEIDGDGVRVVARGAAGAELVIDGRGVSIIGSARRWADDVLPPPSSMTLWLGAPSSEVPTFLFTDGLLPADILHRGARLAIEDLSADAITAAVATPVPTVPQLGVPDPPALTGPIAEPRLVSPVPVAPDVDEGWTFSVRDLDEREPAAASAMPPPVVVAPSEPAGGPPPAEAPADDYDYDALYGHTIARSVQSAAMRPPVDGAEEEAGSAPAAPAVPAGLPSPTPGVIEGVPSSASMPAAGDHDGHTMTKAQLDALRAQQSPAFAAPPAGIAAAPMGGPAVQALACALGHLSPTHVAVCRVCGSPLSGTPVTVARPALGRLRFTSGENVVLDRPVIVGRNPRLTGQSLGELPMLLKLDIGNGLSRSHAIVQLEGWHVLVEDLGSANGTVVTLPGRPPRRLHPGEPLLLEPAAEIDFGGEVSAVYDSL